MGERVLLTAIAAAMALVAQPAPPRVTVPFVGCPASGHEGLHEPPNGEPVALPIPKQIAAQLAWYKSVMPRGVLAPRGWACRGDYGSGGSELVVSPQPIDRPILGSAVVVDFSHGDTSGRDDVAKAVARVFPSHRKFVEQFREMFEVPLPSGPTATDQISRKGPRTVLYRTPPEKQGFGTEGWLKPNTDPIDGLLILLGDTPDLLHVQVRLPANLRHVAPYILHHSEATAR